jgi:arabinose-5-phosphate isomerase
MMREKEEDNMIGTGAPTSSGRRPSEFVRIEAMALLTLAERMDGPMASSFSQAVEIVSAAVSEQRRIFVTGMGKSGIIAQKIAAILRSSCSPANFMHPGDAIHGEIGMLSPGAVVIALSYSGETKEILQLLHFFEDFGVKLISFTSSPASSLGLASDVSLDCGVEREACPFGLSPTASTAVMLALGDALALEVSLQCGRTANDFENLHRKPGTPRI